MTDFLAILGRQPELSLAELCAVVPGPVENTVLPLTHDVALLRSSTDPIRLLQHCGGLIKIGVVLGAVTSWDALLQQEWQERLVDALTAERAGKLVFGCSAYGAPRTVAHELRALEKALKTRLREQGNSVRFIRATQGNALSSVVVRSQILHHGAELLLVTTKNGITIGRTIAVQDYADFSERDYGRPDRNPRSGMLPPKLARIMVNLARPPATAKLLDPFCGSGTVLQEAALLGVRNILGSDNAPQAITETKNNLHWLAARSAIGAKATVVQADVRNLSKQWPPRSINAIVTEPFLGQPPTGRESRAELLHRQRELGKLYCQSFAQFRILLLPDGIVVFALPVVFTATASLFIEQLDDILLLGFRLIQPLPPHVVPHYRTRLTYRHTLLYCRPGQRVGREILILQRTTKLLRAR